MSKRVCALFVATVLLLLAASPALAAEKMITRCNVIMRKSASTSASAVTTLMGGTEVTVLGKSGSWTRVQYSSYKGYIYSSYLMSVSADGYYTLKEGDENAYIVELQRRLLALNYYAGTVTGEFDAATTAAVKAFQKANGLKADGVAGPATQKKLYADSAVAGSGASAAPTSGTAAGGTTTDYTLLKEGMESSAVKTLQQRLIDLGYLTGSATGYYGTATKGAVKDFQKKNGLKNDGLAGSVTQALLYSSGAVAANGSSAGSGTVSPTPTAAPSTAYTLLKKGVTSSAVKTLQEKLISLGYLKTNATGYYGSATFAAVKAFQQDNGLKADGIAGNETQTKLFAANGSNNNNNNGTGSYSTLKLGMESTEVKSLQQRLIDLGYMKGSATGYYGDVTFAAVKAFQKAHGLSVDGVAGKATQQALYGNATPGGGSSGGGASLGAGKMAGPATSKVKLLHWFNEVKPNIANGDILLVFDPATNYCWNLRAYSRGRHLDADPLTADDTKYMNAAFGGVTTWTPKVVYVQLTNGTWVFATMHNTPHLSSGVSNNNFDGHLCVHFLRDMSEVTKNDPNYGVTHQKAIREGWKKLTGQTVN